MLTKEALAAWRRLMLEHGIGSPIYKEVERRAPEMLAAYRKKMVEAPARIAKEKGYRYYASEVLPTGEIRNVVEPKKAYLNVIQDIQDERARDAIKRGLRSGHSFDGVAVKPYVEDSGTLGAGIFNWLRHKTTRPTIAVSAPTPELRGLVGLHEIDEVLSPSISRAAARANARVGLRHERPSVLTNEARNVVMMDQPSAAPMVKVRTADGVLRLFDGHMNYGVNWSKKGASSFNRSIRARLRAGSRGS